MEKIEALRETGLAFVVTANCSRNIGLSEL